MESREREQITNRQIARLLSRLKPLKLSEIAIENIKRYMWFLSEDLEDLCNTDKKGDTDGQKIY